MKPKRLERTGQEDMFSTRLERFIDRKHPLYILSHQIDWNHLCDLCDKFYKKKGRCGAPVRFMVGMLILKHRDNLSDEELCARWVENPYYQYFTGEEYFCYRLPYDRSNLSNFRKRVDEGFLDKVLSESLFTAFKVGALSPGDVEEVTIDTTVQEKHICYPTDAKLRYQALCGLGASARGAGIVLRQSYVRVGKRSLQMSQRYRHAKQMKRAKKEERRLRTWLGRMIRDVRRKCLGDAPETLRLALAKAEKIYRQEKDSKVKLLSWHAVEAECIGKGKAHKPYEFGCKVSLATHMKSSKAGHFILHARAIHGKPYDGHTLAQAMENIAKNTGLEPKKGYVDKGYRGHNYERKERIFISGQKRGVWGKIKTSLRRRSLIEPIIGHAKADHRLGRNYLKGHHGDRINPILAAIGLNFRRLSEWIKIILLHFIMKIYRAYVVQYA